MRRIIRSAFALACAGSIAACAALSGLDQITESECAPDCTDASSRPDQGVDTGAPDTTVVEDTGAGDVQTADTFVGTADSGEAQDGGREDAPDGAGEADATGDTGAVETGAQDAPSEAIADTGVDQGVDAPADSSTHDASEGGVDGGACGTVYFQDSFDNNANGWTLDTSWTIAAECANPPAPQKGNPDPTTDHTGTPGSGVVGAYVCGNNPTNETTAFRYATSPAVNVSGAATLKLGFWRWLNSDASEYLSSTVDVYDGTAWVNVYTNPSGAGNYVTDSAWTYEEYDVTAQKNAAFQVRFGYSLVSTSVYEMSDWNVDDLTLSSASCP